MAARDVPGYFFDEEKNKYFPNCMKKAYESAKKEKEQQEKEQEKKQQLLLQSGNSDLSRFMGSSPVKFDSLSQKLDRMNLITITWSHQIEILADKGVYFRYYGNDINGYTVEKVIINPEDITTVSQYYRKATIFKFGVHEFDTDDFLIYFVTDGRHEEIIDGNNFDVLLPNHDEQDKSLVIVEDAHYYNIHFKGRTIFFLSTDWNGLALYFNSVNVITGKEKVTILERDFDFATYNKEVGHIFVRKGGKIRFKNLKEIQLKQSSAKWLHVHEGKMIIFTYHGNFILIDDIKSETRNQNEIFNLLELPFAERSKFEDFMIEVSGKVLFMAYRGKKEILIVNWTDGKLLKKLSSPVPIEQFKVSSDYSNLYIHTFK